MHLAMITAYFIEHMFGFSKKQKAGSSQMVPALLSLILIFIIQYYDVRGKSPDFDAYELFRATHSHNSPQYSHIVGLSSHFYAHIGAGLKVFHPPMSELTWV